MSVPFTHLFLLEDGKKSLPVIPGISTTPGAMVYAGSIGTQIANELLDFNRCVLTTEHILFTFCNRCVNSTSIFFFSILNMYVNAAVFLKL